jgi:hypothetical protein
MMTTTLGLLFLSCSFLMATILAVRWLEGERMRRSFVAFELRFPAGIKPEAVTNFFAGMAGMVAARPARLLVSRPLILEVTARTEHIRHHVLVPRSLSGVLLAQLHAALPDVVAREDADHRLPVVTLGCEFGLSDHQRPLRVDQAGAASTAMLASLQPLAAEQAVVLQTVLTPLGPVSPIKTPVRRHRTDPEALIEGVTATLQDAEAIKAARAKQDSSLYRASVRLGVKASPPEAKAIMRRLLAPFHILNAPGAHLRRRRVPGAWTVGHIQRRSLPVLTWPLLLNLAELASVVGIPIGELHVSGLRLSQSRPLPASIDIPSSGKVLGDANYPGSERPVAITVPDALRSLWVVGPTGTGKSTLLATLILQDVAAGRSVVVIDPKGDLVDDVLKRLPERRVNDVIVLDPADRDRPVPFNVMADAHRDPELASDQILAVFHKLWREYWGPRTQDYLHAALLTMCREKGSTLVDLPLLLTHDEFRRRAVSQLDDPMLLHFWSAYEDMTPGERANAIGAPLSRMRQLLLRPSLRAILGQAVPTFSLDDVLNNRKVLLVSLPTGLIGEEAASLIGSLIMGRLSQAIYARAGSPSDRRPPAFVYVDEVQAFVHMPTDLGTLLAQARGLGVGFVLAHQHLGQLPTDLRHTVSANARSKIVFQASAADAAVLARELGGTVRAEDLMGLPMFEAFTALVAGGQVSRPATIATRALYRPTSDGQAARAASRLHYGRDRADVDAAIRARQQGPAPSGPTLRRKRGPS